MQTAKLFKNGQSQAVRLPKEFRFEGEEVVIKKIGYAILLEPTITSWDRLLQSIDMFPDDFDFTREQPEYQEKDLFK